MPSICGQNSSKRDRSEYQENFPFQESCFVLETFIARYLHTWNGYEHVVQIMEMVSKLSLAPSFESKL